MPRRLLAVGILLLGSGTSALAYQLVWTRELRLVFGHSTAASAAVLAIFIGGLGAGSLLIGPRADRNPRPLALYAWLEASVAVTAALTPLLLAVARAAYLGLGGSLALGPVLATVVRLLLSALVLLVPTVLMGGTLPAAAREAEGAADSRRRATAFLYGANTLGAVTGALLATFYGLERLGNRGTLLAACVLNAGVALAAALLARGRAVVPAPAAAHESPSAAGVPPVPRPFVLAACATVGFAFFLLELVWYRMLSPLLGGSVFTFGLILATALLGIATGGLAYALFGGDRPATLLGFATTCLLEAAAVAAGFALGDRLAILALVLRPLGNVAFAGHVLGWAEVAALVVFAPAVVAGAQFPLLIALLGRGRENVGRDVGWATATNTAGSVLGALAGGFGLLPLLTAPGCWRLVAALLVALGLAAALLDPRRGIVRGLLPAAIALATAALLAAPGPTAAFRHSGIGAGRAKPDDLAGPNQAEDWLREQRRAVVWEAEGRESSVALLGSTGLAFAVNGKVDGHARYDAGTQVMAGLLGAMLHPAPRRALVVGLGTGSTAGWLADVPGMERVDVVELEPAVAEVARRCALVNRDALANPRVRLFLGDDAREHLLTTRERYDLVVSEPSNPYRAGVASLFSREFYRAVAARLPPGGLFLQWVQAYEVHPASIRSLYATLAAELPFVETWQTLPGDLILVGGRAAPRHDLARIAARVREEPFRAALKDAWRTDRVEGVFARFVAGPGLADRLRSLSPPLNTDDRNGLEFGFARSLGTDGLLDVDEVRKAAAEAGADFPVLAGGTLDLGRLQDERLSIASSAGEAPTPPKNAPALARRADAHTLWTRRQRPAALQAWRGQDEEPAGPNELSLVAEVLADAGEPKALAYVEALRAYQPAEADACLGRLRLRQGDHEGALRALEAAFAAYRRDPWPLPLSMQGALDAAVEVAGQRPDLAPRVGAALREEFALRMLNEVRLEVAFLAGSLREPGDDCGRLVEPLEPNVPFTQPWLDFRLRCYTRSDDARLVAAWDDLKRFESRARVPLLPGK